MEKLTDKQAQYLAAKLGMNVPNPSEKEVFDGILRYARSSNILYDKGINADKNSIEEALEHILEDIVGIEYAGKPIEISGVDKELYDTVVQDMKETTLSVQYDPEYEGSEAYAQMYRLGGEVQKYQDGRLFLQVQGKPKEATITVRQLMDYAQNMPDRFNAEKVFKGVDPNTKVKLKSTGEYSVEGGALMGRRAALDLFPVGKGNTRFNKIVNSFVHNNNNTLEWKDIQPEAVAEKESSVTEERTKSFKKLLDDPVEGGQTLFTFNPTEDDNIFNVEGRTLRYLKDENVFIDQNNRAVTYKEPENDQASTGKKSTSTGSRYPVPAELQGEGKVKDFQKWMKNNHPNFYMGNKDPFGLGSGVDDVWGSNSRNAWATYGQAYLGREKDPNQEPESPEAGDAVTDKQLIESLKVLQENLKTLESAGGTEEKEKGGVFKYQEGSDYSYWESGADMNKRLKPKIKTIKDEITNEITNFEAKVKTNQVTADYKTELSEKISKWGSEIMDITSQYAERNSDIMTTNVLSIFTAIGSFAPGFVGSGFATADLGLNQQIKKLGYEEQKFWGGTVDWTTALGLGSIFTSFVGGGAATKMPVLATRAYKAARSIKTAVTGMSTASKMALGSLTLGTTAVAFPEIMEYVGDDLTAYVDKIKNGELSAAAAALDVGVMLVNVLSFAKKGKSANITPEERRKAEDAIKKGVAAMEKVGIKSKLGTFFSSFLDNTKKVAGKTKGAVSGVMGKKPKVEVKGFEVPSSKNGGIFNLRPLYYVNSK